jgi:SAM-dependent methyltransferase
VVDYDAELVRYAAALRGAWGLAAGDRVVDIGCGTGATTREAARAVGPGRALGVDVAERAIGRARALAHDEGVGNVDFELADAQTHPFPPGAFDVAISRFGTMFFADPAAAFANIGRSLRPGGRLVMLVWQARDRNEWAAAIRAALDDPPAAGPDAFSLADPALVREILQAAEFTDVTLADVTEPVHYGPTADAALAWIRGFATTAAVLQGLPPAAAERAVARLRAACAQRLRPDGVWFDARAWLVTAQAPAPA